MIDIYGRNLSEKHKNIFVILNYIIQSGEAPASELVLATGLSIATVSRTLAVLRKRKVVVSRGKEITEMGRHPERFSLNSKFGGMLHFYMGADTIKGYLLDMCGSVIATEITELKRNITIDEFLEKIQKCKEILTSRCKTTGRKLLAAGFSVPGYVDEKNKVIKKIPNIYHFEGVNLFERAEAVLGVPVIINNEARLCALGEHNQSFPGCKNMIYIDFTKYSGIGAGIILDGKLYTGRNGLAGEIGDSLVSIKNFENEFHKEEGCLESMAGFGTLLLRIEQLIMRGRAAILKGIMQAEGKREIDIDLIERALIKQDLDVTEVFDETVRMWAMAVLNLAVVLDPDVIVLGGTLDKKHGFILARIRHYLSKVLYYDVDLQLSGLGEEAQLLGGVAMLKKYVYNNILFGKIIEGEKEAD